MIKLKPDLINNMAFEKNFKKPPEIMSPLPFWFLNDDLKEEDITRTLEEFKDKHIHTVIPHPRSGMEVEYLSDDFWKKISFIIKKSEELGLKIFLYDEYNWPSGAIGGKLMKEHPEYRQKFLDYKIVKKKMAKMNIAGEFIAAFEVDQNAGRVNELMDNFNGKEFFWESPGNGWECVIFYVRPLEVLLYCTTCAPSASAERGYIDLLNPDAAKYFIKNVHEEYRKRFSKYFGNVIIGFFTDEPGNYAGWMWTTGLLEKIKGELGFDLKPKLYQMVYGLGDDYLETRNSYYKFVSQLYANSYYKQIGDWCKQNNLMFTGHLISEEELISLPRTHGSLFLPLREMQLPGIDYLSDKTGYDFEGSTLLPSPNFTPKMISSLTHHLGLGRNLCETFGGCGWKTTLKQLKRTVAWIECCGVNWISPHAAYQSIKGLRKRDFPPSHFVQEPWWKYYAIFSDFVSRLSYFNSLGTHIANFCILFPRTAFNLDYTIYKKSSAFKQSCKDFSKIGDILLRIQCDFDYIFEDQITEDTIQIMNNELVTKYETYKAIIIPPISNIPLKIYQFLLKYYQSGGTVIFTGVVPKNSEKNIDDGEILDINKIFFGTDLSEGNESVNRNSQGGKIIFIPRKFLKDRKKGEQCFEKTFMKNDIQRDIIISKDKRNFIYQHRKISGENYYLISNLSEKDISIDIQFNDKGYVTIFYPETGKIYRLVKPLSEDKILKDFKFRENQALILLIKPNESEQYPILPEMPGRPDLQPIKIKPTWEIKPAKENIFLFNNWNLEMLSRIPSTERQLKIEEKIESNLTFRFKFICGAIKPFMRLFQSKKVKNATFEGFDLLDHIVLFFKFVLGVDIHDDLAGTYELSDLVGVFTKKMGVKLRDFEPGDLFQISKNFIIDHFPENDIKLVYEDIDSPISFIINGKQFDHEKIKKISKETFVWDKSNREFSVKDCLKIGKNHITVKIKLPEFADLLPSCHGLEPIALMGDFSTRENKIIAPVKINNSTPWQNSGLSNYAGAVIYKNKFNIPKNYLDKKLILEFKDVRETVELKLNGRALGVRPWPPFEYDITGYVKEGDNILVAEVRNTAENLFGRPMDSGILGDVLVTPYNIDEKDKVAVS